MAIFLGIVFVYLLHQATGGSANGFRAWFFTAEHGDVTYMGVDPKPVPDVRTMIRATLHTRLLQQNIVGHFLVPPAFFKQSIAVQDKLLVDSAALHAITVRKISNMAKVEPTIEQPAA